MEIVQFNLNMKLGVVVILLAAISLNLNIEVYGSEERVYCIEKERQALVDFRAGLTVFEDGSFPSWNAKDCCKWGGVECSNQTGRVIKLDLTGSYYVVVDKISPSLLELRELNYLDLSAVSFNSRPIPKFFGSFTKLQHLDLGNSLFAGLIPSQLGNLSNLNYLSLSSYEILSHVENIDWLSRLSSLETLKMDYVDLSRATKWVDVVKSLPFLSVVSFSNCQLSKVRSSTSFSSMINSSNSQIKTLDLSDNDFTSSMYSWLFNMSRNLIDLHLQGNMLNGPIVEAFGDYMPSLQYLDLSFNQLEGMIPSSFGNMCDLVILNITNNFLSGNLSDFVNILFGSGCPSAPPLGTLLLNHNKLYGPLPDGISRFFSLNQLYVSNNKLNETLTENLGTLSSLRRLDLSSNSLTGTVSEAQFSNLSLLTDLDLSLNPLHIEVSHQWVPRFQLRTIGLMSCNLGPSFPNWIQTQKKFTHLDMSNTGISGSIPTWFWGVSANSKYLNLSSNNIGGTLPNLSSKFVSYPGIDFSSNNFEGSIPLFPSTSASINLSGNRFSGTLSFLCQLKLTNAALSFLDISNNSLTGKIPDCLGKQIGLVVVNLANNRLSGEIPSSLGDLSLLETLYLYNNRLSGELPMSLSNCQQLTFLDVGENKLFGIVPAWIGGRLLQLGILSLRSNNFFGTIPLNLCQLQKLQVLDLSINSLDGTIPRCFNNLSAMVQDGIELSQHDYASTYYSKSSTGSSSTPASYADYSVIVWQGRELKFGNNLRKLKLIDLSTNNLSGDIPSEITRIFKLVALNLSRNALRGKVPEQIGQLKSILTLDLSRNEFSGKIPASLSQLSLLNYLDLSYNKLFGKIPLGTQLQSFDASKFIGNVGLCGPPLTTKCPGNESPPTVVGSEDKKRGDGADEFMKWLYIGMASGFVTGFWGICGALFLNRRSRHVFLRFVEHLTDWIYVKMAAGRRICR